jgi:glycosyltransferase involved in cell wall biosynthesis
MESKMNVGFLVKNLAVNGANRMIQEYSNAIAECGEHEVTLYVEAQPAVPWLNRNINIAPIDELKDDLDVLISTYFTLMPYLDSCKSPIKAQLIMDNYYRYGAKTDLRIDKIEYSYLHQSTKKFVVSHYLQEMLRGKGVQSHVIHPGLDSSCFFYDSTYEKDRSMILVEGYSRISKSMKDTYDAIPKQFNICGLGIEDHKNRSTKMYVLPHQEELRRIYSKCFAFVKIERRGGFPQAPLESMACGTPIICSDESGHLDYCLDRFNCLVAPSNGDVKNLLIELLDDDELYNTLVINGKETAKVFSWARAGKRMLGYLIK